MIAYTRRTCVIALASIWCLTIISGSFLSVNARQSDSNRLPILLIHGYGQDSSVWNSWRGWLAADNFSKVYSITFPLDDRCGLTEEHAMELKNIVDKILSETHSEKVNIVAHSKGGLDARWYIANSDPDKVANLIMIGTPNAGSPAAFVDITGCPFGSDIDLFPGSLATQVVDRPQSTNYYTIAGNWMPNDLCLGGSCLIPGPDDGLVAVDSVESSPNYIVLGQPVPYDHFHLLEHKDVYERALPILDR
ncbi:MAG: alpha/beta fold hydrolase [Nitrososphaeraceae archaeon]